MRDVIYLALGANLCFAIASQIFTYFSRVISAIWMNCFKALIALFAFGAYLFITQSWVGADLYSGGLLFLSGFLGLAIGDVFLLKALTGAYKRPLQGG